MSVSAAATLSAPATIATGRRRLVNVRERSLLVAKWRAIWVLVIFGLVAFASIARLAWLGVFAAHGPALDESLLPSRGEIVDRNGIPLAREISSYSLWFNPKAMRGVGTTLTKPPREVAEALHDIFPDLDVNAITALLASGKAGFIRKQILPEDVNRVKDIGEPALEAPMLTRRYYPQGAMGAHVLGYMASVEVPRTATEPARNIMVGRVGMEQVLNGQLTSLDGRAEPAVLSIDARVQGALEDEIARGMALSDAKGGAGVVLDVDTGEVIALASLPTFNPNQVTPADLPDPRDPTRVTTMFNRLTNQTYELGSVFKPITVAAAIEHGTVTNLARRYPAGGQRMVGGHLVHDDKDFGASLNVPEALVHSSNIVLAQVGEELGEEALHATLAALGFGARPRIELPGRGFPTFPKGKWPLVTTTTVAYGHGVAVTPLHMALAYAALVNGGVWHPATLHRLPAGAQVESKRVFQPATSARIRELLRMIVKVGTGRSADAPGYRIGGKTGTAEIADKGGYHKDRVVTTFASAFPMDHPRYVALVTLTEPQKTQATSMQRTAAWNAAPTVGRLIPRIGPMLGIMPDTVHDIDISDVAPLVANGAGE